MQAILGETGRMRDRGDADSADAIDGAVSSIRSSIDRELGRAGIGVDGTAGVAAVVERVASVLRHTPRGEDVAIDIDIPPGLAGRLETHDLTEAMGTGLGLALAQDILEAAGCTLDLRNRPDGFEVIYFLPAAGMAEELHRG